MEVEDIKEIIEKNPLAFATCDKNNNPHAIAVADVKVISNDELLIGDNYMKKTIDNIKENSRVSLVVWENLKLSKAGGYELIGEATYYKEGKYKELIKNIHRGCPAKGAIVVKINEIKKLA